jgi:hypothetical protein
MTDIFGAQIGGVRERCVTEYCVDCIAYPWYIFI